MRLLRRLDEERLAQARALVTRLDVRQLLDDPGWEQVAAQGTRRYAAILADGLYAQLSRDARAWDLEVARDPTVGADMVTEAVSRLLEVARAEGGELVQWWVALDDGAIGEVATALGLEQARQLWFMSRSLPVDETTGLEVRAFVPGVDEEAWLALNNRAFAGHPDQSNWRRTDLAERMSQPWFDPSGFLLHEQAGRLIGFCWTKVEDDRRPLRGEIHIIGVDPDHAGQGLGRSLVVAGLEHLHRVRGAEQGVLYVDGENTAAVRLYERLGFRREAAYVAWSCRL